MTRSTDWIFIFEHMSFALACIVLILLLLLSLLILLSFPMLPLTSSCCSIFLSVSTAITFLNPLFIEAFAPNPVPAQTSSTVRFLDINIYTSSSIVPQCRRVVWSNEYDRNFLRIHRIRSTHRRRRHRCRISYPCFLRRSSCRKQCLSLNNYNYSTFMNMNDALAIIIMVLSSSSVLKA